MTLQTVLLSVQACYYSLSSFLHYINITSEDSLRDYVFDNEQLKSRIVMKSKRHTVKDFATLEDPPDY